MQEKTTPTCCQKQNKTSFYLKFSFHEPIDVYIYIYIHIYINSIIMDIMCESVTEMSPLKSQLS